jgi:hypothetical protein
MVFCFTERFQLGKGSVITCRASEAEGWDGAVKVTELHISVGSS